MSLKCKVIGIGQAGNKAAIQLVKDNVLDRNSVMLLNTTMRDIPEEYRTDMAIQFGMEDGGCGKDRDLGKKFMEEAIIRGDIPIDDFIDGDEKFFVIVSSTEGGTGSGASVRLGEYIRDVTKVEDDEERSDGIPVNMVCFTGFEDDTRGRKNTVEWFKDLSSDYVIQAISNKACMRYTDNNRRKAEEYANKIFSKRIEILMGKNLNPSDSNVDNMDLFKLNEMKGYMTVEFMDLDNVHDEEQFEEALSQMIEHSVSIPTEPSCRRLGIVLSAPNKLQAVINEGYDKVINAYGFPSEIFRHKQDQQGYSSSLAVIASGMKMPYNEIKAIYSRFEKAMEKTDMSRDSFFDAIGNMDTNIGMKMQSTNPAANKQKMLANKSKFFEKYGKKDKKKVVTAGESRVKDEI